ncbi:MAG: hypothetical protein R2857_00225 [Vampirovibrionales bacterium]
MQQDEPVVKIPARPLMPLCIILPIPVRSRWAAATVCASRTSSNETINEHQKASKPSESAQSSDPSAAHHPGVD